MHPGLGMQLDSEIELPFTGATVGDDSTLQYTLNFPGCNLSPPHCPLSPDIASLEVHFRIIITISPTDISLKRHSCPCVNIQWTSVEIHYGFHLMTMLGCQMRNTGNISWPEYVSTGSCVCYNLVCYNHIPREFPSKSQCKVSPGHFACFDPGKVQIPNQTKPYVPMCSFITYVLRVHRKNA